MRIDGFYYVVVMGWSTSEVSVDLSGPPKQRQIGDRFSPVGEHRNDRNKK